MEQGHARAQPTVRACGENGGGPQAPELGAGDLLEAFVSNTHFMGGGGGKKAEIQRGVVIKCHSCFCPGQRFRISGQSSFHDTVFYLHSTSLQFPKRCFHYLMEGRSRDA